MIFKANLELGFNGNVGNITEHPTNFELKCAEDEIVEEEQVVTDEKCTYDFKVTGDWGTGYNGEILITNNTQETIDSWMLSFEFEGDIEKSWVAEIVENNNGYYILKGLDWNADITPGQTINIGFTGTPGNIKTTPKNYKLIQSVNNSTSHISIRR